MNLIFVDYDPFCMESKITIIREGKREYVSASSDLPSLVNNLLSLSREEDLYNVRAHAPVEIFYELQRQIQDAEKNLYNENKVRMEIV